MSAPVGLVSPAKLREARLLRQSDELDAGDLISKSRIPYESLSEVEHAQLIADAQMGDLMARGQLLRLHSGLIEKGVRRLWFGFCRYARGFDIGDLRQVARMGFLRAIHKYDPARAKLSTYARWWIRQYAKRFIEDNALQVRVPVHAQQRYRSWREYKVALKTHIREAMEAIYEDVDDLQIAEAEKDDENEIRLRLVRRTMRRLHQAGKLSNRDIEIIMRRYTSPGESLKQVGESYGLSRERIRQIEEVALAKIRYAVAHPNRSPIPSPRAGPV